jgi:pyruvate dehydrogenase E1 component subunit alpha
VSTEPMAAQGPGAPAVADAGHALELLRRMLLVRRFEEACAELYSATQIRGFLHLAVGEEATAVGAVGALAPDDTIVATYREHAHALARGIPAGAIMAEMFGRVEGCSRGRGGSMHLFDVGRRFMGGNAIVAGGLPLAVGMALADSMRGRRRVTACFFGDGAVAEGEFHESMNLAGLWRLPVLFLCENNRYAMGTAIERELADTDIAAKASAYAMPGSVVDGMDVLAVEASVAEAASSVRDGAGPRLVELRTYRFRAHSMYDPERYRDKAEVERWRERDPLRVLGGRLRDQGALDDPGLAGLERAVADEVAEAIAFAEAGTWEPLAELTRFVHSEPG